MTRLERLQAERDRLIKWRNEAMKNNDFVNMSRANDKIAAKEKEIGAAKKYAPMRLLDILNDKGEDAKNRIYKALIKISLAADFVNDCAEDAKSALKELGINDFTLRADAAELCELSQKIASFVIFPGQRVLTDMMVNNDTYIEQCHRHADAHLKRTLKLK